MKKYIFIFIILLFIIFNCNSTGLDNDTIRFRIIPNSNSDIDIKMKIKVINEIADILVFNGSKNEVKENINNSIPIINNRINELFINNNYNKSYNIVYGLNYFPEKKYNNKIFSEGEYESLVIKIGDGNGDNYWCFLYPSLCMVNDDDGNDTVILESRIIAFLKDLFM